VAMSKRLRRGLRLGAVVLAVPILVVGVHLGIAAWNDPNEPLPPTQPGRGDASRGSSAAPAEVVTVAPVLAEAESQLCALVRRAAATGRRIAIAGARHSMGGHTMLDDAIVVDTTPLAHVRIDAAARTVTAGAGASWRAIVPRLQREGLAVKVMQSNDDFTIGGSLAVNCHGWQQGLPPIASTVRSLRVVTAGGEVVVCTRDNEHRELFRHVLGGYGLFGIVTEATLEVVDDAYLVAKRTMTRPETYLETFQEQTADRSVGMTYGRISVSPLSFLESASVNVLRAVPADGRPSAGRVAEADTLARLVFRGTAGSSFGKLVRDWGESWLGQTPGGWRSELQSEPVARFTNRDPGWVDLLHESFVPMPRLAEFVAAIRPMFAASGVDLLNLTVRDVQPDLDTALPYARVPVFGVVMLFHVERTDEASARVTALTRAVIDAALDVGGTYYLTYRNDATVAQFERGYPQAAAFFAAKRRLDPQTVFANRWFVKYARP